jgi:hypothetical protein
MLQAQTHRAPDDANAIQLCHTDCRLEDAGRLRSWLTEIRIWMEAVGHENEVVTLLLTNGDGISMQVFGEAFQQSGAENLCFAPEAGQAVPLQLDSWPTLGEIIGTGKRLVVFIGTCGLPCLFASLPTSVYHVATRVMSWKKWRGPNLTDGP